MKFRLKDITGNQLVGNRINQLEEYVDTQLETMLITNEEKEAWAINYLQRGITNIARNAVVIKIEGD